MEKNYNRSLSISHSKTSIQTPTQGRKRASPPPIRDIIGKKAAVQPPATPPATAAPDSSPILDKQAAAGKEVDLPTDPTAMPSWSDFTELHLQAMHNMFSADRRGAEVVNSIRALAKEAAGLTNRLATETDADVIRFTQEKLDKAIAS
ncbi:TPA: hypothetical protein ACH3X1_010468 [Trebouxia sp. C0004]